VLAYGLDGFPSSEFTTCACRGRDEVIKTIPYLCPRSASAVELMPGLQFDMLNLPPGPMKRRDLAAGSCFVPQSAYSSPRYTTDLLSELRDRVKAVMATAVDILLDVI
jgi:hypothetical protein